MLLPVAVEEELDGSTLFWVVAALLEATSLLACNAPKLALIFSSWSL